MLMFSYILVGCFFIGYFTQSLKSGNEFNVSIRNKRYQYQEQKIKRTFHPGMILYARNETSFITYKAYVCDYSLISSAGAANGPGIT